MHRHFFAPILILTILAACAPAPKPDVDLTSLKPTEAADALGLGGAEIGYLLIDAGDGEILEAQKENQAFPPASTAKVPTAIAALGVLGPNYRFATDLWARGSFKDGVLDGDIALMGNGDPLLSMGDLRALAQQMRDFGMKEVKGRFLYTSSLPAFPLVEPNQPAWVPYNQGIGGLNLEYNRANAGGAEAPERLTPAEAEGLVSKPAKRSHATDVPVRDPARLAARMLRRLAEAEGTNLPAPIAGPVPPDALPLARVHSRPLIEIVRAGLEYSNNLVAESVGLATAEKLSTHPKSLHDSATASGVWLERHVPGLARFAPNLRNHSGLSTESRVTPQQMTSILRFALGIRFDGWRFDTLLPPGGGREGYHGRFKQKETAFRIWGKTGTMKYIKGLVGYLDANSGRRLICAVFTWDPVGRAKYDSAGMPEHGPVARTARDWQQRAERFEEVLITRWISAY